MSVLIELLQRHAQQRRVELPPSALEVNRDDPAFEGPDGLSALAMSAGWPPPERFADRPGPNAFPLLMYHPHEGWLLGEQWENADSIRAIGARGTVVVDWSDEIHVYLVELPDPVRRGENPSAFAVFRDALLRRRGVLAVAMLATVVANILTLATSLFSMQVYDRVIPRSSFSTLWVLVVGVAVALAIDFALRSTRSLMVERESALIDAEVSEFFFARSQAIRLDARPPSVGTMAANMRGMESVRSAMSSSSLFLVADLPFALFFIAVIAAIGGAVALVPLIAFPISIGIAVLLAFLIRKDTERAQVSGNRKNGLLVESLDAAETVKANRGNWHLLGRWNRLVEETHLAEDPVKKLSAIAGSIFSSLQQFTYVLLIAVGAFEVAAGRMTTGALVASAIIAGRVNGPLIAQLPNMIVQWQYARISLKLLDGILALPLDEDPDVQALRPDSLAGSLRIEAAQFAYPGVKETIALPLIDIPEGQRVGVIGGIGSGKSTMLRVMAGLYRPSSGRVLVGGVDMSLLAGDILRREVGYLGQDARMINGTLRDNLLLGLSNPGDEALMEAGRETLLSELIGNNPRGLDLPISEGGRGLSGGQRTIACLTRLLLADPKIWLLDEPTSNLDQATELRVRQLLQRKAQERRTMVLVTHRTSLLGLVDRVIVMAGGRVALDGPRDEVLDRLKRRPAAPPAASADAGREA
jgi:ATP-binding cassette, subfamily C, bacterial LapB